MKTNPLPAIVALGLLAIGFKATSAHAQSNSPKHAEAVPLGEKGSVTVNDSSYTATYLRDVLPIFMGKCTRCHNGQTILPNWLDYKTAFGDRREIKRRVWDSWKGLYYKQPMPAGNGPECQAMTEDERMRIKDWVDAGAVCGVSPTESGPKSKPERIETGKRLFAIVCTPCHQATGQGIPEKFPPLAGSDFLNADKNRAIKILLNGRQGEIVVNGQKFNNSMPLFPLGDEDIANALTYVYNSFGNSGKEVTPDEVKALRGQKEDANDARGPKDVATAPTEKSPWE